MTKKDIREMNIGDEIVVEYGCYGNYTKAIIIDIKDTEYPQIKIVDYTIPNYTKDKIYTHKMLDVDIKD